MRVSLLFVLAVFAWPSQAKASAQLLPLDSLPMSGPFVDLTAACEHLERAVPIDSANWTPVAPARCKQIDAAGSAAVLLAEREDELGAERRNQRLYAVVLHRRDGWWMSPNIAHSYRDGDAAGKFGSNCCNAAESSPKYAAWGSRGSAFQGTATVLRVVMHGWSVSKKGWPGEGRPGNSETQVSFTICGTMSTGVASCYAVRSGCSCMAGDSEPSLCLAPQVPSFAIEDNHLVLHCPERKD